jgi:hypothetical protein
MIPFVPRETADMLIFAIVTVIVAATVFFLRRRAGRPPPGEHEALMKRAETHAGKNAFLRNMCRQYKASGHLSQRQAEQVEKALARLENGRG